MIQVCSGCGTRWNVRDRQRAWCPRCNGALLAPSAPPASPQWAPRPSPPARGAAPQRLPPGYRWIAVRPGAPPPPRRGRRPLGPTPRYAVIPRWGLVEYFEPEHVRTPARTGPSATMVRTTLVVALALLGAAALVHAVRYLLLIINRSVLLNPWVAGAATWLGVAVSVLAVFAVVAGFVVLTNWLIARRAAAYAHHGLQDPRRVWELRAGCLIPLVNLFWAPVYVIELAGLETRLRMLRRPIAVWWIMWVLSTAVSVFSIATSFTQDPQGIADNTVTTTVAYLLAMAALLLAAKVFAVFERKPVERPAHRWIVVAQDGADEPAVEAEGQNPAA